MTQTTQHQPITPHALYIALELSHKTWKLAFTTDRIRKARIVDVEARDLTGFLEAVERAAKCLERIGAPVVSCYEAGRDGFWIHRFLESNGVENVVIDPASIEVSRRLRNAKTDRLDAQKMVRLLVRHHEGEPVLRQVRVPPLEAEDERILPRQLKSLKRSRTRLVNQIRSALVLHGVDLDPKRANFRKELGEARQWDRSPLPAGVQQQIGQQLEQLDLLKRQIRVLEKTQHTVLTTAPKDPTNATPAQQKAAQLTLLRGIGETSAYVLSTEFFGWREFRNRKQVGAAAGLTGTPFASGEMNRDQGISKAGNSRVRGLMVELSWLWLRFQPQSKLSIWFREHVGKASSRGKRSAIVAMARKLLIALWRFVEHGVIPDGAVFGGAQAVEAAA